MRDRPHHFCVGVEHEKIENEGATAGRRSPLLLLWSQRSYEWAFAVI
jgi:hypothetical protein